MLFCFPARSNARTRGSRLDSGLTPRVIRCRPRWGLGGVRCGGPFSPRLGAHAPSYTLSPPLGAGRSSLRGPVLTSTRGSRPELYVVAPVGAQSDPTREEQKRRNIKTGASGSYAMVGRPTSTALSPFASIGGVGREVSIFPTVMQSFQYAEQRSNPRYIDRITEDPLPPFRPAWSSREEFHARASEIVVVFPELKEPGSALPGFQPNFASAPEDVSS